MGQQPQENGINHQAFDFLQAIPPFSFLPEAEIRLLVSNLTFRNCPADTNICRQGATIVEHLYIIRHGSALRYFETELSQDNTSPMGEGDLYGGISMLINNSVALRSLKTLEPSTIYLLTRDLFLEVCQNHPHFRDYFTDTFGKRMLDRSYRAIVTNSTQADTSAPPALSQTVRSVSSMRLLSCLEATTIQQAALLMSENGSGSILVENDEGDTLGIVTDRDLRQRLIAAGQPSSLPVSAIMSSPVKTISGQALIFEAVMTMMQEKVKRLAVTNDEGTITGIVTTTNLLASQSNSPLFLLQEMSRAKDMLTLREQHDRLPEVVRTCITSGAKPEHLNRLITNLSDTALTVIIDQAFEEIGNPPCTFSFLVMGSDGRREQTLKTDQDNAILYPDPPKDKASEWHEYFVSLGKKVCNNLNTIGYSFCQGEIMARNPTWCQPISIWKEYFSSWVKAAEPEDLLSCAIFFDFRCGYGDTQLVAALHQHLQKLLAEWPSFLQYLAFNAHHFKPPLGFFRNFIVESKGEHRNTFDIKKVMVPIVDFARTYSLKHGLTETNTQERLRLLASKKAIRQELYQDISQAYSFLMQLRLSRQAHAIQLEMKDANNYINPKKLSRIEQTMLKEIFNRIDSMQKEAAYGLS